MGIIKYDGNKIIPAPLVGFERGFNQLTNGQIIGQTYTVTVTGTSVPYMGSPTSSGTFHTIAGYPDNEIVLSANRLQACLNKQKALLQLFNASGIGKKFEILNDDSATPVYFFPRTISVNIPEGQWHDKFEYTITMETDNIYPTPDIPFGDNIESASESWSIEPDDQIERVGRPFTYRVSHNISAKGKPIYVSGVLSEAWVEAKDWARARAGINYSIIGSGINNVSNMSGYNHTVAETIDIGDGSYTLGENWLFASGSVLESYNVNSTYDLTGITRVTLDGSITGLELRDKQNIVTGRWNNASGYYNSIQNDILNRAQTYAGVTLNPIALSNNVGRNIGNGTISYSFDFDNRPSTYISGALSESITVSYGLQSRKFAAIPVIGRSVGPILQGLGSSEAKTKSLSIEFVLGPRFSGATDNDIRNSFRFPIELVSGLVNALDPVSVGAYASFYDAPQETFDPFLGRGSYSINWTFET